MRIGKGQKLGDLAEVLVGLANESLGFVDLHHTEVVDDRVAAYPREI